MAFQRSTSDRVSPVRQQYQNIKREFPGHVLFFRLGDFYELFDDDAEIGERELDLVLTKRPVSRTERVAMAGIPHHVLDQYVARLVAKGYPVAVCEQTDDRAAPGLIRREVTATYRAGNGS